LGIGHGSPFLALARIIWDFSEFAALLAGHARELNAGSLAFRHTALSRGGLCAGGNA